MWFSYLLWLLLIVCKLHKGSDNFVNWYVSSAKKSPWHIVQM